MADTKKNAKGRNEVLCNHCKKSFPRVEDLPWKDNEGNNYCNSCGAFLPRVFQKKIGTAR